MVSRVTPEGAVKKAVEDLLKAEQVRYWRMNSGNIVGKTNGRSWRVRGHAKGTPDLIAAIPMWMNVNDGEYFKKYTATVWIELKAPGKAPTDEQLQFADAARANDEVWLCIDDVRQLQEWLKENRVR